MKTCSRCKSDKPDESFSKNKASPSGRHSVCKACRKEVSAAYLADPAVKQRQAKLSAERYAKNRERLLEKRKARYESDKSRALEQNRRWREANLEKHRAMCRDWAASHPHAARAIVARRRARKAGASGSHTKDDVLALQKAQGGVCVACHADLGDGFHVDHIIPLTRGGSDSAENLQLLCPTCNRVKSNKLPHELSPGFYKPAPKP